MTYLNYSLYSLTKTTRILDISHSKHDKILKYETQVQLIKIQRDVSTHMLL